MCVQRSEDNLCGSHLHTGSNPGCQAHTEPSYGSLLFFVVLFIYFLVCFCFPDRASLYSSGRP